MHWIGKAIGMMVVVVLLGNCGSASKSGGSSEDGCSGDCRQDMRQFVQAISVYGKAANPHFLIVPQNGHPLLTTDGEADSPLAMDYIFAIDGVGREDLFFGYTGDNEPTPEAETSEMIAFMNVAKGAGIAPLVTDYVAPGSGNIQVSYELNDTSPGVHPDYISFAATSRGLDNIPEQDGEDPAYYPYLVHSSSTISPTTGFGGMRNFLYLLDPSNLGTKAEYLAALQATNYDLLVIDAYDGSGNLLDAADVATLKTKDNGGPRLVIAYMSIGEAENYRYYWESAWDTDPPSFIAGENPDWPGNFKVRYWDPAWQAIITGNSGSYTQKLLDAGFDGVYLDIVDAFEYWEE